jgi:ElaB/YqjD/DUF883 family membrane-anchored ribosome-binding protein
MVPPSEPRSPERIREDLERAREATRESLDLVRRELRAATDWREWVRRRPWTCLSIAAALGLGLGLVTHSSGGPHGNAE